MNSLRNNIMKARNDSASPISIHGLLTAALHDATVLEDRMERAKNLTESLTQRVRDLTDDKRRYHVQWSEANQALVAANASAEDVNEEINAAIALLQDGNAAKAGAVLQAIPEIPGIECITSTKPTPEQTRDSLIESMHEFLNNDGWPSDTIRDFLLESFDEILASLKLSLPTAGDTQKCNHYGGDGLAWAAMSQDPSDIDVKCSQCKGTGTFPVADDHHGQSGREEACDCGATPDAPGVYPAPDADAVKQAIATAHDPDNPDDSPLRHAIGHALMTEFLIDTDQIVGDQVEKCRAVSAENLSATLDAAHDKPATPGCGRVYNYGSPDPCEVEPNRTCGEEGNLCRPCFDISRHIIGGAPNGCGHPIRYVGALGTLSRQTEQICGENGALCDSCINLPAKSSCASGACGCG